MIHGPIEQERGGCNLPSGSLATRGGYSNFMESAYPANPLKATPVIT